MLPERRLAKPKEVSAADQTNQSMARELHWLTARALPVTRARLQEREPASPSPEFGQHGSSGFASVEMRDSTQLTTTTVEKGQEGCTLPADNCPRSHGQRLAVKLTVALWHGIWSRYASLLEVDTMSTKAMRLRTHGGNIVYQAS